MVTHGSNRTCHPAQTQRSIAGHVLGKLGDDERLVWNQVLQRAAEQVECWVADGIAKAMNRYNGTPRAISWGNGLPVSTK